MTLLWLLALGLLIGGLLGGLGGGGAVLTVPALVHVVGQSVPAATTSSLVIVGLTAAVGVLSYLRPAQVRWRLALAFGLVGLPAAWTGSLLSHRVEPDLLMLGFSVLMVTAAAAMLADPTVEQPHDEPRPTCRRSPLAIVVVGTLVGLLTGFFGVGGGFVIVPALVLALGVPMQHAVGTSLLIVALNSATSLLARTGGSAVDWQVILPFTAAAMLATLAGRRVAGRLPERGLRLAFAGLLVAVAGHTAFVSVPALL